MSLHVVVYKDTAEGGPNSLVQQINDMCGSVLVNPRPDLRGDYIITDVASVQVIGYQEKGWGAVAIVEVQRDPTDVPIVVSDVVASEPVDDFFTTTMPLHPGEIHEIRGR
jgi:hypothetical protein